MFVSRLGLILGTLTDERIILFLPFHIPHGRSAKLFTKDRNKGAGILITQIKSDLSNGLSCREQPKRLMKFHELTPTRK